MKATDFLFFAVVVAFMFYHLVPAGIVTEARPAYDEANFRGPRKADRLFGERKHNGALSFFVRKTISEVSADEAQRSKFRATPRRKETLGTARGMIFR